MFEDDKRRTLIKLELAIKSNLVDEEVIPIINKINELNDYYTTSSCIGRCGIMEFPKGKNAKIHSRWLGKWHHYATYDELFEALSKKSDDFELMVFVMNSPILHIAAKDTNSAKKMVELAIHNGLKASSIKSVSDRRVIVEILGTYKIDTPIGKDGKILVNEDYLKFLLDVGNFKLKKSREILMRWCKKLEELNNK
jgi:tRNA wybutosine-synthesizing protein 3